MTTTATTNCRRLLDGEREAGASHASIITWARHSGYETRSARRRGVLCGPRTKSTQLHSRRPWASTPGMRPTGLSLNHKHTAHAREPFILRARARPAVFLWCFASCGLGKLTDMHARRPISNCYLSSPTATPRTRCASRAL